MFSRRHYEYLARWLATGSFATTDDMARNLFASSLADRLGMDNPRFDRKRFLAACKAISIRPAVALAAD